MLGLPIILATVAIALLTSSGCVDDDKMFYIRQNQVPDDSCKVSTEENIFRSRGRLDLSVGWGYQLYPLIENKMNSTQSLDGQPERNVLHLRHIEVELDLGDIPVDIDDEELNSLLRISGMLKPNTKLALGSIEIISDPLARLLSNVITRNSNIKATILASIRVVATRSGDDIKSSVFIYPVELCNGCLVDLRSQCPSGDEEDTTPTITNACGLPQDQPVTCCTGTNSYKHCFSSDNEQ